MLDADPHALYLKCKEDEERSRGSQRSEGDRQCGKVGGALLVQRMADRRALLCMLGSEINLQIDSWLAGDTKEDVQLFVNYVSQKAIPGPSVHPVC